MFLFFNTNFSIDKRLYGLKLGTNKNGYLYYWTLWDLPTISEAHKTLDMKTFYKSCDISQIMYVHPNKIGMILNIG